MLDVADIQSSNPLFSISGNTSFSIQPYAAYQLPVLFSPVSAAFESGTLSIISNDLSSPNIINLSGEGIFPPVISVSPDSFFYDLNVGDSITTQLFIDNSSGLGELTFQISDRLLAGGTISKTPNHNYLKFNKTSQESKNLIDIDFKNLLNFKSIKNGIHKIQNQLITENPMMSLPVIIQDIIGDGGIADINQIRGQVFNDNLQIEYVFADGINISVLTVAILLLDIDRNPMTGATDPFYFHDLGVDYYVYYYPPDFGNEIYLFEYATGNSYSVPYNINGSTISYSIPLIYLDNYDGEMDLLALSGNSQEILDWAPNEGHGTLADVFWLTEDPSSGVIPPGGNLTIEIRANTSELIGGNYLAGVDIQNNDPAKPGVEIPFALHLTGIPQIIASPDSLNFGETYIGYYNSLLVSISSSGTDSLIGNVSSSAPQFILIDSDFALPVGGVKSIEVQFHPAAVGIFKAELTIISNASPTPQVISLSGEGLIAPNITTNINSIEFESNPGDTISSGFVIHNTGGSNLVVEISDVVTNNNSERLFAAGFNMIYEISTSDGQILNSFPTPVFANLATGLAFSGDQLFFTDADYTPNIFVLDPQNGNIITSYPSQSNHCDGLAYVNPYLYALDSYYPVINVMNPQNGNRIKIIYPTVYIFGGLDGGYGRLFSSEFGTIYELDLKDGSILNSFSSINGTYGIGFTGEKLYSSVPWAGIDEYDPNSGNFIRTISTTGYPALAGGGIRDAEWLTENPLQVVIPATESATIGMSIVVPDEPGQYYADIILDSNDPDSSVLQIHVLLDVVTGIKEENPLPTVYSLYNNYPNPFNPSTKIVYTIQQKDKVILKVFDIVGNEIATLVDEEQKPGKYEVQFSVGQDTSPGLASGIYFYKLQTENFTEIKKMILIK